MKIKKLSLGLMVLAFVALTSVGFAAWVITGDVNETVDGNIQVDQAIDARIDMDVVIQDNKKVVYGFSGNPESEHIWLVNDEVPAESLTVTLVLTINNWATVDANIEWFEGSVSVTSAAYNLAQKRLVDPKGEGEADDVYENLLGELPSAEFDKDDFAGDGVYEITLTFTWGDAFKVDDEILNPYLYYNVEGKSSAVDGDEALARLNHIFNNLNEATYTVTVTAAQAEKVPAA